MRRRVATAAGILLATIVLSGCTGVLTDPYVNRESDGGRPSSEVVADLEALPGVGSASFSLQRWDNPGEGGLFSSSGMNFVLEVAIEPDHHVAEPAAFLDAVLAAAWSVNDGYSPKGLVSVVLAGGLDPDFDWDAVLRADLGTQSAVRDADLANLHVEPGDAFVPGERILIGLGTAFVTERFGDWPADPSALPGGLLSAGPPPALDPVAVSDFNTAGVTSSEDCWSFTFERAANADLGTVYTGDVEVTMLVRGTDEGTQVARGADVEPDPDGDAVRDGVSFCYDERRPGTFDTVTFAVVAPAEPGFQAVDLAGVEAR